VAASVSPARLAQAETNVVDCGKLADVTRAVVSTLDVDEAMFRLVRSWPPGWPTPASSIEGPK
jgi:hypothetical protein